MGYAQLLRLRNEIVTHDEMLSHRVYRLLGSWHTANGFTAGMPQALVNDAASNVANLHESVQMQHRHVRSLRRADLRVLGVRSRARVTWPRRRRLRLAHSDNGAIEMLGSINRQQLRQIVIDHDDGDAGKQIDNNDELLQAIAWKPNTRSMMTRKQERG